MKRIDGVMEGQTEGEKDERMNEILILKIFLFRAWLCFIGHVTGDMTMWSTTSSRIRLMSI